jgi:hypothetical protein
VDVQIVEKDGKYLSWLMNGLTAAGTTRQYKLYESNSGDPKGEKIRCIEQGPVLKIDCEGMEVLQYWHERKPPPEGVAEYYGRSAFIHPLRSPSGAELTRIQPPDHYHHYGLWNPWTHTRFRGEMIDFWNLAKEQATVRTHQVSTTIDGAVFGGFTAIHDHVVFAGVVADEDIVALKENWEVRVWGIPDPEQNGWIVDFTSEMACATDSPFTIVKYRYQGFGLRGRADWNDENCQLVTSEMKNKADGNATRARWCYIQGPTEAGVSGILFMTHPDNHDYPELLRIWPTGANKGKENVFFNFNPAQDKDWELIPGEQYLLKYRMYIFDAEIDNAKAEMLWRDFATPPSIKHSM